jgi:formate dehydrogenase gamma subunit
VRPCDARPPSGGRGVRPGPAARLVVALFLAGASYAVARAGPATAAPGHANGDCLACHADPGLTAERRGRTVPLHVDPAVLAGSVHGGLVCTDCHAGFDPGNIPHKPRLKPVDCTACHGDVGAAHAFHPRGAVACTGCHGTHDIAPPRAPGSKFAPDRLAGSCGACHAEVVERYRDSAHGRASAAGVKGAPDCLLCHRQPITSATGAGEGAVLKRAQERLCLSCHLDDPGVRARTTPDAGFIAAYESSVHGKALARGDPRAATCIDCHGAHEMKKGYEPTARVNKRHIPETCGACHPAIASEYARSIHAAAVARGNLDAPVCTDCHGEHDIQRPSNPSSRVAPANVSAQVCSPCHSSVRLSRKYGIPSDRFKSFSDSFHGLAIREGAVEVANCASCHRAHAILPSKDPASSVNKANLASTCGKCHPGANARFAVGSVHVTATDGHEPILYWVATAYIVLIVSVIGGMAAHNLLDFARKARRRLRIRRGAEPAPAAGHALHLRMTLSERLQHGALLLSFTVLVVTGFMLHYPEAGWVGAIRRHGPWVFEVRAATHRAAGVVMVLASIVHLYYLAFTPRGREFLRDILPRPSDLSDLAAVVLYNLGLRRSRPLLGRFSYVEKSEYWALVWGTIVMAATGVILWFEDTFIGLLTKLGWDIARTIHFYEACLATLAILVWHLYFVIFSPDVYPMNPSWLTGTITEEEMEEEHPLELRRLRRIRLEEEEREREAQAAERDRARRAGAEGGNDGSS